MATLYRADGTVETVEPKDGKAFRLKELYEMLDCTLVQIAYPQKGYSAPSFLKPGRQIMIVDEEFLYRKPAHFNMNASRLYGYSPINGDALVCLSREFK